MTLKVLNKRCDQCLFSGAKIVGDQRKRELLVDIRRTQGYFVCHKATLKKCDAVCRGFYDDRGGESQMVRIAERLGFLEFVDEKDL